HPQERQFLADYLKDQYPQWLFEVNAGFNLCFYGYGSKKELLEDFVQEMCLDGPTVVVYGYAASASIKEVLAGLMDLPRKVPKMTRPWKISRISHLTGRSRRIPRLYLLVHNLDGPGLSSPQAQEALLTLASIPNISLLASVDHINAGLLLNPGPFSTSSFLFHDSTTFVPYITEQSAHASLILRLTTAGNGATMVNKHSAQLVLASLTDNARDLFRMLGQACIDSAPFSSNTLKRPEGTSVERGITYEELFSRCRAAFIVNSEATFKSILGEFRDHDLLTETRGSDGSDVLSIPLTTMDLEELCGLEGAV
ncbi:origin recognition complex, subunit 2, partial [Piptocephalis cylindrospora]